MKLIQRPGEIAHYYGGQFHILNDRHLRSILAALCQEKTGQPLFNHFIRECYGVLLGRVLAEQFPARRLHAPTRMIAVTPAAVLDEEVVDPNTRVVVVDVMRAGILPGTKCFDTLNTIMTPANIRQDHLVMSRVTDEQGKVTGVRMSTEKIGGDVEGAWILLPDPMGATGGTISKTVEFYKNEVKGNPARIIAIHLIITPEYVRHVRERHPDVIVYAGRLDRGLSHPDAMAAVPGEKIELESGLTSNSYIVPGGGGFGELMNNAFD
ncbi:MAG: hypothetical protein GMKNLPBB_00295 [Myxococcota bacterium]|nr:hypothetical protein [Myxococcota bacterium]